MTETATPARDEAADADMRARAFKIASELLQARPAPAPAVAWHEHGAFDDIEAARWQISRARDALAGIAALMQPESLAGDEQLNMARRSDASAVFAFFAEAMQDPLEVVDSAATRLKNALRTGQP